MTVTKLPTKKAVLEFWVYVPGERMPTTVRCDEWGLIDGHVLQFTLRGQVVAVFHGWDYFESPERPGEGETHTSEAH
jgi:hypothetical protein